MKAKIKHSVIIPDKSFKTVRWCNGCVNNSLHLITFERYEKESTGVLVHFNDRCLDCQKETGSGGVKRMIPAKYWAFLCLGIKRKGQDG